MKGMSNMEYVLEDGRLGYILIFFVSCFLLYLFCDIKFKLFKIGMLQEILGWTDNQMKLFSAILIVGILWGIFSIYIHFLSVKLTDNELILKYLKPRPPVIISKGSLDHYEVSVSQDKETKGNLEFKIYLKDGRKYDTGIDAKRKDILNQLTAQLDILIKSTQKDRVPEKAE